MSNSGKPGWPTSGAFPFMPFPIPGLTPPTGEPTMSGGVDLLKTIWGSLPGSAQLPGFLMPTVDVDELDKRIGDLRAAESWVEVNLAMLRATIQGLEVQRHTIAALKSLSTTPSPSAAAAPPASPSASAAESASAPADEPVEAVAQPANPSGLPGLAAAGWLTYMQDQFAKVAGAALSASGPAVAPARVGDRTSGTRSVPKARKRRVAKR